MLLSLMRSEEAIIEWSKNTGARATNAVETLRAPSFWWQLRELLAVIKPLHVAQRESEARNASVMDVCEQWIGLQTELRSLSTSTFMQQ